jgi:hypothetical protein
MSRLANPTANGDFGGSSAVANPQENRTRTAQQAQRRTIIERLSVKSRGESDPASIVIGLDSRQGSDWIAMGSWRVL